MRQTPLKFTLQIQVKPYVKKFIETNYGVPVDFTKFPEEHLHIKKLLKKPNHRFDSRIKDFSNPYTDIIEVLISEDDFYRYGWELTKTNTVVFGKHYENRAKFFMRTLVGIYTSLGLPIFKSIQKFQEKFDFTEDDWKYEAIKKDFYRNGIKENIDFDNEIFNKIENLIMVHLSELGTIAPNTIYKHETSR